MGDTADAGTVKVSTPGQEAAPAAARDGNEKVDHKAEHPILSNDEAAGSAAHRSTGNDAADPVRESSREGDASRAIGDAPKAVGEAAKSAASSEPDVSTGESISAQAAGPSGNALRKSASYCVNIANPAIDARYRLQKEELEALRADIQTRTAGLENRIAELKDWFARREAFVAKARENLVGIYSGMKPEAAARQLSELDDETSSALIAKLDARQSGAILSEMDAKKAAQLTSIIAGVGRVNGEGDGTDGSVVDDATAKGTPQEELGQN